MLRWMLRAGVASLAAIIITGQPGTIAAPKRHRTPPDSFLQVTANSIPEFIAEVKTNALVRKRMARHFKVSEKELVSYLERNITTVTVKESGRYPVWGVTRTGRIYRSSTYYRRGWRAFGLKNGTPLFKWSCGNPMAAKLPAVPLPVAKARPAPSVRRAPPVAAVPVDRPEMIAALATEPQESIPVSPSYVMAVPQSVGSATPLVVGRAIPAWLLLPLVSTGGGGGPTPTPEPCTVVIVATGGLFAALLRRRKCRLPPNQ